MSLSKKIRARYTIEDVDVCIRLLSDFTEKQKSIESILKSIYPQRSLSLGTSRVDDLIAMLIAQSLQNLRTQQAPEEKIEVSDEDLERIRKIAEEEERLAKELIEKKKKELEKKVSEKPSEEEIVVKLDESKE